MTSFFLWIVLATFIVVKKNPTLSTNCFVKNLREVNHDDAVKLILIHILNQE